MGMTPLPSLADKLGFVLLYLTPNAQQGITCWDANTAKSLTHDGGSDSQGITGMVAWALKPYDGDTTTKVFVVGDSSGAMESNVLVFAGAASYSGVPADCWGGSPISTSLSSDLSCPLGKKASTYTPKQWGDAARGCNPGYSNNSTQHRPKMMIMHVTVGHGPQLDQWSDMLGVSFSKNISNGPIENRKKIVYGDGTTLVGYEV
ncbi:hypothetical protein SEUCBS139899_009513 [Sporothrix eucalyptigena]